jgi:hypothetical protein
MPYILSGLALFVIVAAVSVFGYFVVPVMAILALLAVFVLLAFRWLRAADALPNPSRPAETPTRGAHRGDTQTANERVGQG